MLGSPPMKTLACIVALAAVARAGDAIAWSESLAAARAAAVKDGKPVLLYFTFDT